MAPSKGSLEPVAVGDTIAAGPVIARVSTQPDTYDVTAPHGGQVLEWLVEIGDPVSPGQPLLRLHPIS